MKQPLPLGLLPEAGGLLAQLHAVPPRAPGLTDIPVGTRRLSDQQCAHIATFPDRPFAAWLNSGLDRVRGAEEEHRRAPTVVHGDLFDDNIVVRRDGGLSVLDWETISLDDPLLDLGMAAVGLAREGSVLVPERLDALVSGYRKGAPDTQVDPAALLLEIEHAALIIAFHRYYRHSIRFPDPEKAEYHTEMVTFVDSVRHMAPLEA